MNVNFDLAAPWIRHYRKVQKLFERDRSISVLFDTDDVAIKLYVDDEDKAAALDEIIKSKIIFGNVTLTVDVILPNDSVRAKKVRARVPYTNHYRATCEPVIITNEDIYLRALSGNRAFDGMEYAYGPGGTVFRYVVFRPEVVQYFCDDISSYNGCTSTLYESIAKDVFEEETGVFFCTSPADNGEDFR